MSETEYSRLDGKLSEIALDVGIIKERLISYPDYCAMLIKHDRDIELIKANCATVQEAKKNRRVNWGAVIGYIIGALAVAIIVKYLPI
jgi:hypothetical protein